MVDRDSHNRREMRRLQELLRRLEQQAGVVLDESMHRLGIRWTNRMGRRVRGPLVLSGRKGDNELLATRSGELANSFGYRVNRLRDQALGRELVMFSSSRKAAAHEYGAEIRPRRAPALTIPLTAAMTPSGVPRYSSFREARETLGRSRTFVFTSRRGSRFLAYRRDDRTLDLLYLLHPGPVKIPPRLGMRDTLDKMLPRFRQDLVTRLRQRLQGGG